MANEIRVYSRAGLRELDRRAVEEYHIPILVLMENAGRAVAEAALRMVRGGRRVLILAGPGNNGGDGLVAARYLHNAKVDVTVLLLAPPEKYQDAAAVQLKIVEAMKLPMEVVTEGLAELRDWMVEAMPRDLIIDAIFGTGLSRPPEGVAAEVIRRANRSVHRIMSVDIPSGMDCDTGLAVGPEDTVIRPVATVSFCGSKPGFARGKGFAGKVKVAPIGVPRELVEMLAVK